MRLYTKTVALAMLLAAAPAWTQAPAISETRYRVTAGPVEAEVTPAGLDVLWHKDLWLLGDSHSDPRPAVSGVVLTTGWKTLASTAISDCEAPAVSRQAGQVRLALSGVASETGGAGRWAWRQELVFEPARVVLRYELQELASPTAPIIGGGHRLQFVVPRDQVLGPRRPENVHEPGLAVQVTKTDGEVVSTPFGGQPNISATPAAVALPFGDARVTYRLAGDLQSVELWNGGWEQRMNLFLRPGKTIRAEVTVDLGELVREPGPVAVEPIPPRPRPWLTADLPERRRPDEVLRLLQCTPAVRAYDKPPTPVPTEEKNRLMAEVGKHFEAVELFIAWSNWWYARWDEEPKLREHARALAREAQEWVDAAHRHGVLAALSLSWAAPGCSEWETALVPQFQGEYLDPDRGEFVKDPRFFDWSQDEAAQYAYRAWRDVASLLRDVDFLFFNEPTWRLQPWHRVPLSSPSALASWRAFTGRSDTRLPAKAWCKPTDRTDGSATVQDWRQWQDWLATLYARMIQTQARAVADANASNPRYRGAIWFQNKQWVGPEWACDLDRLCALPEVTYIVCEYCTDARAGVWREFRYFAAKHGKKLSSFVNFGYYDSRAPGRVRYEGTAEGFAAAAGMGVGECVDMIAAYPAESVLPWSEGFHAERTRLWDEITGPYVKGPGG